MRLYSCLRCSRCQRGSDAASAPFVYVMTTFAPSAARRLAMAAPMPREPPVMSAIFPSNFFDIVFLLELHVCSSGMSRDFIVLPDASSDHLIGCLW
jgi:hypothetical protein